ncbi:aspartate kinase [Holosporaceae bacterium 'Namur']|nr:aspartate kinase [Holosporaceae bacterium 'Namur']
MALIVQKFGGTSVGTLERIRNVVKIIRKEREQCNKVVVVASAMAGITDNLVNNALFLSHMKTNEELVEYDSVIASGEQISCGLLALALINEGFKARSWLGWQVPIYTDGIFSNAKITHIETKQLIKCLEEDEIPVIAGFQGVYEGRVITLGRGGSDTTAAAIAAALKAERCDIYTDVDGVYTADPRIVPKAKKLKQVAFDEMLEMASSGAKVLHARCVEIAMKFNLKMQVLSSFDEEVGTMIVGEDQIVEKHMVTGITCKGDIASITLKAMSDVPGSASQLFDSMEEKNINVDLIVQNIGSRGKTDLTITIAKNDLDKALDSIETNKKINCRDIIVDDNVAKISIIGIGMKSHSGVAQKMFQILADRGINILVISTSEIKISVLVHAEYKELAVRALHAGYGLDK